MRRPLPSLAALLALLLSAALAGCTAGSSGSDGTDDTAPTPTPSPTATPVPDGLGSDFFGMHDADPVGASWPQAQVGSIRVWDSGAVWNQVEKTPGQYDFSRLDAIVKAARDHHASALIVLGQTPAFHSRHPKKVGAYGPGAASMPDLAAWTAYVRAVVERYHAPDVAFQVWNEANVEGYWNGTYRQMAQLTAAARAVVDAVTPTPTLVAPAMATRTLGQRAGIRLLYGETVGGVPLGALVDVVSLQLYPENGQGLVRKAALLAEARRILGLVGVPADKPVWDTEINFGLQGGDPAPPASREQQMTNLAMSYLLDAADSVDRVYWYSWDLKTIANTELSGEDGAPTDAGRAFDTVHRWLLGSKADSCDPADDGVWVCMLTTPSGPATVFWNPDDSGSKQVRTAFGATSAEILGSTAVELPLGGSTLDVGQLPVLVTSDASGLSDLPPRL